MDLTNEIIERNGFKKVNNSMWKRDCITLQNAYTNEGGNIVNKILTTKKAYKVCVNGKYLQMITYEDQIHQLLERKPCVIKSVCVHPYEKVYQSETECYCEICGHDFTEQTVL